MKFLCFQIVLLVCVLVSVVADVAHIKATKTKLLGHLTSVSKHHKRGILSHIPPYKLGHDIPLVTHSIVKPFVVTYPPTAAVAAVKFPLALRHPASVGHRVHGLPHPHYALRFPHSKYFVKHDNHFHHHHHHIAPKPLIPAPIPPPPVVHEAPIAPIVPLAHPTASYAHSLPSPILHQQDSHLVSAPVPLLHHNQFLKPLATIPLTQPSAFPIPQQYVIRPGAAVQTSYFAQYPRYPFVNSYQSPIYPVPVEPVNPAVEIQLAAEYPHYHVQQVLPQLPQEGATKHHTPNVVLEQTPNIIHSAHEVPQPAVHLHPTQETFHVQPTLSQPSVPLHQIQDTFHVQPTLSQTSVPLHQTQETFHVQPTLPQPSVHLHHIQDTFHVQPSGPLHPTQGTVPLEHNGWSPVSAQPQDSHHHDVQYTQQPHHFVQEQGNQVYEHHTDEQYHDLQHQIQQHIQHQIEQAQYEQSLNTQHQLAQEYGVPQPTQDYGAPGGFQQQEQDFSQHVQDYHTPQLGQNDYDQSQPGQEYGLPQQGVEGRSSSGDNPQFHNHVPLGLQPPIDRPLDHFQ